MLQPIADENKDQTRILSIKYRDRERQIGRIDIPKRSPRRMPRRQEKWRCHSLFFSTLAPFRISLCSGLGTRLICSAIVGEVPTYCSRAQVSRGGTLKQVKGLKSMHEMKLLSIPVPIPTSTLEEGSATRQNSITTSSKCGDKLILDCSCSCFSCSWFTVI